MSQIRLSMHGHETTEKNSHEVIVHFEKIEDKQEQNFFH